MPSLERKIDSESLELSAKPRTLRVRGFAERAESTESERFKEPTDLLLSAREAGPRTDFSFGERAFGCGRWDSALTEPFHSYVRSLIRTPLRVVASYSGDAAFETRLGS